MAGPHRPLPSLQRHLCRLLPLRGAESRFERIPAQVSCEENSGEWRCEDRPVVSSALSVIESCPTLASGSAAPEGPAASSQHPPWVSADCGVPTLMPFPGLSASWYHGPAQREALDPHRLQTSAVHLLCGFLVISPHRACFPCSFSSWTRLELFSSLMAMRPTKCSTRWPETP